jgi:hypothetical protein
MTLPVRHGDVRGSSDRRSGWNSLAAARNGCEYQHIAYHVGNAAAHAPNSCAPNTRNRDAPCRAAPPHGDSFTPPWFWLDCFPDRCCDGVGTRRPCSRRRTSSRTGRRSFLGEGSQVAKHPDSPRITPRRPRWSRGHTAAVAATMLPLTASFLSVPASAQAAASATPLAGSKPAWATPSADRGATPAGTQLDLRVYLAGRDPQGLAPAELRRRALSDPGPGPDRRRAERESGLVGRVLAGRVGPARRERHRSLHRGTRPGLRRRRRVRNLVPPVRGGQDHAAGAEL